MFNLYYSNHLEALVEPLAERIRQNDPFTSVTVAVPNRNLQMWLNIQIAQRLGIAANIRFRRLDPLLVSVMAPELGGELSDNIVQMMILRLLEQYKKDPAPELMGLKRYLASTDRYDAGMRAFQLSRRLVGLFREYAFSRMEMVTAWEKNKCYLDPENRIEAWQRRLWRDLFGPKGIVARRNKSEDRRPLLPLHQMMPDEKHTGSELHFFGISYVSRFHQVTLRQLADHRDVFMYVLNPCRMFWEDMRSRQEVRNARPITKKELQNGELEEIPENPFLQAWGKPGREYMRLLNDAANWDFRDHFSQPQTEDTPSLLHRLQIDILDRQAPPSQPVPLPENDTSLMVMGCPSPRREAEVVANTIFQLMLHDSELKLQDIAIIVTDMDTYQTEVESALLRTHNLPFNLVDGVTGRASRLIDAVILLLELPDGRFDRETVFRLYRHPNFRARFPKADIDTWLTITDELAIFHDRAWQAQRSYLDKDLYNWEQGFKRLLLGEYMHSSQETMFRSGSGEYLVHPITGSDSDQAHLFFTVSESLMNDTDNLHNLALPAAEWAEYLRALISTYLAPGEGEDADFERICRAAMRLSELGEGLENELETIRFSHIRAFMMAELKKLSPFYGQYLADGITVSSFMPMRPIPFKTIFVMGLDEQRFPRSSKSDTLDLRWANHADFRRERQIGDVTERERDRYMFLETMIAARQRLVLSYVDRSETTGDAVNASTVLSELLYHVAKYKPDFSIVGHPLKSYSSLYAFWQADMAPDQGLVSFDPVAGRLKQVRDNRSDLMTRTGGIFPAGINRHIAQHHNELGLGRPALATGEGEDNRISITMYQLRSFLECPLQATASRALGLREEQEDLAEKKDEPFYLGPLTQAKILTETMGRVLAEHQGGFEYLPDVTKVLERVIHLAEAEGIMPTQPFYGVLRGHLLGILDQWRAGLSSLGLSGNARRLRFGRADTDLEKQSILPSLELDLELDGIMRTVEIAGSTNYLFHNEQGPHLITFVNKEFNPKDRFKAGKSKYLLRGFLDSAVLAASGVFENVATTIVGTDQTDQTSTINMDPTDAKNYLGGLVTEMLGRSHDYLLPVEAVFLAGKQLGEHDFQQTLERQITELIDPDGRQSCSSKYGPIRHPDTFHPLPNAEPVVRQRFGPLINDVARLDVAGSVP